MLSLVALNSSVAASEKCALKGKIITELFFFLPSAVERYNPQENRWHTVSPMGTRRKHLGCAVYQDMIYSVGGRDDTTELSSAERYNPRTNQWSPVVAMTSRRSGVSTRLLVSQSQAWETFTRVNAECLLLFSPLGGFSCGEWAADGSWWI